MIGGYRTRSHSEITTALAHILDLDNQTQTTYIEYSNTELAYTSLYTSRFFNIYYVLVFVLLAIHFPAYIVVYILLL